MTEAEEKTRSQLKFRRAEKTLTKIIDEEWARGKISPQEIKGGCLRRKVSGLRAAIAKWDLDESGLSLAESTACGGDYFEHRMGGCPFRRRGTVIGASYYAIWDTMSPGLSFAVGIAFVLSGFGNLKKSNS